MGIWCFHSLVVFSSIFVFLFLWWEGEWRKSRNQSRKSTRDLLGRKNTLPRNDPCHLWHFFFFPQKSPVWFLSSLVALAKTETSRWPTHHLHKMLASILCSWPWWCGRSISSSFFHFVYLHAMIKQITLLSKSLSIVRCPLRGLYFDISWKITSLVDFNCSKKANVYVAT